jgi:hypothetical protein
LPTLRTLVLVTSPEQSIEWRPRDTPLGAPAAPVPTSPAPAAPAVDQGAILQQAIVWATTRGWQLVIVQANTATMSAPGSGGLSSNDNVIFAIAGLVTFGLGWLVWLIAAAMTRPTPPRTLLITVDERGQVAYFETPVRA